MNILRRLFHKHKWEYFGDLSDQDWNNWYGEPYSSKKFRYYRCSVCGKIKCGGEVR